MNRNNTELQECTIYFKANKGFERAFSLMKEKWCSYGDIKGKVTISGLKENEKRALEGLGLPMKSVTENKAVFSLRQFEEALQQTKFKGICLTDLLESYFGEKLISNKEKNEVRIQKKVTFFSRVRTKIVDSCEDTALEWFDEAVEGEISGFFKETDTDEQREAAIISVCKAVDFLFGEGYGDRLPIRLVFLALKCTGNPHGFDRGSLAGRLLIRTLQDKINQRDGSVIENEGVIQRITDSLPDFENTAEGILDLYISSGIRPDDISSYTVLYGIRLFSGEVPHPGYEELIKNNEQYMVNLSNLQKITKATGINNRVYIVENQSLFSELCNKCPKASIMCTSGQFKTASVLILLMLRESCTLYYSGDLDPEGMDIAIRMKDRIGEKLKYWHMSINDYIKTRSMKKISESGKVKLERLKETEFREVCEKILETGMAGQQEYLLNDMVEEINIDI